MVQNRDLNLLARQWEQFEFTKDKKYLLKYFDTDLQRIFLAYYLVFGDYEHFTDHTGFKVKYCWLTSLEKKYLALEKIQKEARLNMDLEKLAFIESGKHKINKLF